MKNFNIISFLLIFWKNNPAALLKSQSYEPIKQNNTHAHSRWMPHVISCNKFLNLFHSVCLFLVFFWIISNIYNQNLIYITSSHGRKHLTFLWFIQNISRLRPYLTKLEVAARWLLYTFEAVATLASHVLNIFKREHKHSRRHYYKSKNLRQITGKRQVHLCFHKAYWRQRFVT